MKSWKRSFHRNIIRTVRCVLRANLNVEAIRVCALQGSDIITILPGIPGETTCNWTRTWNAIYRTETKHLMIAKSVTRSSSVSAETLPSTRLSIILLI